MLEPSKEITPPATPTKETAEPKYSENKHTLDDVKTQLEVERLELEREKIKIEKAKLATPNTNIDYYGKMLEMQNAFNQQILSMQKNSFDTQLQLAKLEMGQQPEPLMWIDALEPLFDKYAPMLFAGITGNKQKDEPIYVYNDKGELIPNPKIVKQAETSHAVQSSTAPPKIEGSADTATSEAEQNYDMQVKEYQQQVREGKISLEQAWQDFTNLKPNLTGMAKKIAEAMTYEDFKEQYDKLRSGKA